MMDTVKNETQNNFTKHNQQAYNLLIY